MSYLLTRDLNNPNRTWQMNDSGITPEAKALIDTIIEKQEGGWKLTSNANDPDGGWTYAGFTAKELGKICYEAGSQKYPGAYPLETFKKDLEEKEDIVKASVYNLYYTNYYQPLHIAELPASIRGPMFSAAVNCGVETAVSLLQKAISKNIASAGVKIDGVLGPATLKEVVWIHYEEFLREWMLHYINLVQKNAEAWEEYAQYERDGMPGHKEEPTVNRAASLEGWFNRVEFWR